MSCPRSTKIFMIHLTYLIFSRTKMQKENSTMVDYGIVEEDDFVTKQSDNGRGKEVDDQGL